MLVMMGKLLCASRLTLSTSQTWRPWSISMPAATSDPADEQPALKFPQRRPGDGPAHREARGDLMLAGDARTRSASREVVDERVDDLGVLAFAHINTMTRQVVQTTRHQSTDLQAKVNIRASCR